MSLWTYKNIEARIWPLDHCPPHVTFVCRADAWTARIEFSMVNEDVRLMDVKPQVNAPAQALINELANQVLGRIRTCRKEWWRVHQSACIDNKPVRKISANEVSLSGSAGQRGVVVAKSASYQRLPKRPGFHVVASIRWTSGTTKMEVVK
jgi:hypothetical protein